MKTIGNIRCVQFVIGGLLLISALVMGVRTEAADLTWQLPEAITDDTDVITFGSLDRAYAMGYGPENVMVKGVSFARFGKDVIRDQESIADGQTELVISGEEDSITTDAYQSGRHFTGLSTDYQKLLSAGVYNQGSPWALVLNGLVIGKTYFLQLWMTDPLDPMMAQTVSGGTNSVQIDILSGCLLTGTFVADSAVQTVIFSRYRGSVQLNAFQLRMADDVPQPVTILRQPLSTTVHLGGSACLSVLAAGNPKATGQWQKVINQSVMDQEDSETISGAKTSTLSFQGVTRNDAGDYRVIMTNPSGSITSSIITVSVSTNQLINALVCSADPSDYRGLAVLPGNPDDIWNNVDARDSFANAPLVDSTGGTTPITLSVTKSDGSAVPHPMLGGISYAATHQVTISHLVPHEFYDLVVFSVGSQINEGGLFSGAINGMTLGYPQPGAPTTDFLLGTNYVENPIAQADALGDLTFTIKGNGTVMPGGYYNGDFNGLQLTKSASHTFASVVVQQPSSFAAYERQPGMLVAYAATPTTGRLTFQWQRINPSGIENLIDSDNITGTTSNVLTFKSLGPMDDAAYQMVAKSSFQTVTSSIATVTVWTNQLINVAVTDGGSAAYQGRAVLPGVTSDRWNEIDARNSFSDEPLVDSLGRSTPVTLTLNKVDGTAVLHPLVGGISYSSVHNITINHLLPNEFYDLVVFSVGGQPFEGGVFSGAINGISRGYAVPAFPPKGFVPGTNYVQNAFAQSDGRGSISFTIKPNATAMPRGHFFGDFNGLQILKTSLDHRPPAITEPPLDTIAYFQHPARLMVAAVTKKDAPLSYQWQKVATNGTVNITNTDIVLGSRTGVLEFRAITARNTGNYQVVVMNSFGSVTSSVATVTVSTNQLINIAVTDGSPETYKGVAVLPGGPDDIWTGVDSRNSFTNLPVFDATGQITPVTLALHKSDGTAVRHPLLGGISYASSQTVTINNLLPNQDYDLAVFSVGGQAYEGGVFSGAVGGMAKGYPQAGAVLSGFSPGVNYVENQSAHSDFHGTLTFTIAPNVTAMPGGYFNCDFNGLQLRECFKTAHVP